jgi:hypothetical protein
MMPIRFPVPRFLKEFLLVEPENTQPTLGQHPVKKKQQQLRCTAV